MSAVEIASKRSGYALEGDMEPIIKGAVELPNVDELHDKGMWLDNLAAVGHRWNQQWGYSLLDGRKAWTMFYLTTAGMGSALDGAGYAVIYTGAHATGARILHFAICKHEKADGPGANHSRGWHPGRCSKCGLDMTIDSGD